MKQPIFIVGSGRSGTTLLQRMMRSHSRISSPTGESHFFVPLYKNRSSYGNLSEFDNIKHVLEEMHQISREYVEEDLKGLTFDIERLAGEFVAQGKDNIVDIISALMEKNARGEGKQRWLEKTPYYILHIYTIMEMFPDAQFIHILRDGRDCALSMLERKYDLNIFNVYQAAENWKQYVDAGQRAGRDLPKDCYFEVRYEDLIDDSERILRQICRFINEAFEMSMVDFEKSIDFDSRTPMLGKSIQKRNSEKWRTQMSGWDIRVFESVAATTLQRNGYPVITDGRGFPKIVGIAYRLHERFSSWYCKTFR